MKWNEVKDDKDIDQLNEVYSWFEDAVIVSMGYVSGNSVDGELFGHMEMKKRSEGGFSATGQRAVLHRALVLPH